MTDDEIIFAVEAFRFDAGPVTAVTLRLIARMRQFARVTAAYLRISWDEIINYAAIMIMSRT